jgi:hypothetical protein
MGNVSLYITFALPDVEFSTSGSVISSFHGPKRCSHPIVSTLVIDFNHLILPILLLLNSFWAISRQLPALLYMSFYCAGIY